MNNEIVRDYLEGAGMEPAQAEALSRILGESATRNDFLLIDQRMESLEQRLELRMDGLEEKLTQRMDALEQGLRADLIAMKEELTWRFVALFVALAALMTALNHLLG